MQTRMREKAGTGLVGADHERRRVARHARGGRRHVSAFDQESILELQKLAGNYAVAQQLVGSTRNGRMVMGVDAITTNKHPSDPVNGLADIRKLKNGSGILGYTIREIAAEWAPLLRPEAPTPDGKSWTTKAHTINFVPEPKFEEYWPTKGLHKIAKGTHVDIDKDWEDKLHVGEDQHAADATYAWEQTWKKLAAIINGLAKEPGPRQPTKEAAEKDLWKRYRAAVPEKDLIPKGETPSDSDQKAHLSAAHGSFFRWMFETTYVRDTRGYHFPKIVPSSVSGKDVVNHLEKGESDIPGMSTEELSEQVRKKYVPGVDIKGTEEHKPTR